MRILLAAGEPGSDGASMPAGLRALAGLARADAYRDAERAARERGRAGGEPADEDTAGPGDPA
jgi:hypothetical protein